MLLAGPRLLVSAGVSRPLARFVPAVVYRAPAAKRAPTLASPRKEVYLAKQRSGGDVEALLASRVKRIQIGFMGDGRDTAAAVAYLASYEARFVTGTEIVVDCGMFDRCD